MMNMKEYWENEYAMLTSNFGFDEVYDTECKVFDMDEEELVVWADAHNVDLTATVFINGVEFSALEVWGWDFQ